MTFMPGKERSNAQTRQSSHALGKVLRCASGCLSLWHAKSSRGATVGYCDAGELPGEPGLPAASFADLPARKVLTLNMDVPEPWLVEPVQARPPRW